MDSNDLINIANRLKISNFLGVFADDQIRGIKRNQIGTMIVNTDPSYLPGGHWLSLFLRDKDIFVYDPLSLYINKSDNLKKFLIRMNKTLHFNTIQIQRVDSVMCGYHALVFCFVMKNGGNEEKFNSFLQTFASYNVIDREQLSLTYYTIIRKNVIK